MARRAAETAERAAARLDHFLRERDAPTSMSAEVAGSARMSGEEDTAIPCVIGTSDAGPTQLSAGRGATMWLPHTDWLFHRLTISGSAPVLDTFKAAAAGSGTIPWPLDAERLQEDLFHRLVDPARRSLSLHGARVLARQLRNAAERRHNMAVARVGRSTACPLDLHALVPVPDAVLHLGSDHPDALSWLWGHWGTTDALRQVATHPGDDSRHWPAPPDGAAVWRLTFWAADWTPWRAFVSIETAWPALRFDVRPVYDAG